MTTAPVSPLTSASGSSVPHHPASLRTCSSALQLLLELVEEAPISAPLDKLLGAGRDHADVAQPQAVEPDGVLGIVLAPAVVGDVLHRLEGVIVVRREAAIHHPL